MALRKDRRNEKYGVNKGFWEIIRMNVIANVALHVALP